MKTSWLKRMLLCSAFIIGIGCTTQAQPWHYDFGSTSSAHINGVSTTFLPAPPSGNTRVRIGSQGGAVELRNPGDSRIGSASEAVLIAPGGSSLNKMQWHDFNGSRLFTLQATVSVGGGTGDVYFFCGNGGCFSDNVSFASSQIFAALRWVQDSSSLALSVRSSNNWTAVPASPMLPDSVYLLELYANNSNTSNSYNHGTSFTVAPHSFDVWVDGNLLINDHSGAGLADSIDIDSFMFYAAASPSNVCTLTIDDLIYTNSIAAIPLPVELSAFEARLLDRFVMLRWRTERNCACPAVLGPADFTC